jgi:hypothetical protein
MILRHRQRRHLPYAQGSVTVASLWRRASFTDKGKDLE